VIGTGRDVPEGTGPTATVVTEPPVFEVPSGKAVGRKIGGDGSHKIQGHSAVVEFSEFGNPASTVNDDDNGMWPLAGRNAQFAELQCVGAVSDTGGVGHWEL
jgi:hypothetical protein